MTAVPCAPVAPTTRMSFLEALDDILLFLIEMMLRQYVRDVNFIRSLSCLFGLCLVAVWSDIHR